MGFSQERFQNLLVETIESQNEYQFEYILNTMRVNINVKLECLENLSIFEKVLSTPNSQKFIEMCLMKGCNFYQKNSDGIYPLHYAISSLSAKNLNTLIKLPMTWFNYLSRDYSEVINHTMIVNVKLKAGDNYLHYLINRLNQENSNEVSEMIKTMLLNRCNPNLRNNRQETPFFLLMKKFKTINDEHDLINFFINNSKVKFNQSSLEVEDQPAKTKDFEFMMQLLEQWDEQKFVEDFEEYKTFSQLNENFGNECAQLFEATVVGNFASATSLLLKNKVNVNSMLNNSNSILAPAFSACFFGYHQVLKVLLTDSTLDFKSDIRKQNLLHKICIAKDVHINDRMKCFDLIIADPRCNASVINGLDGEGQAPLYYACFYGFDEIAKELLRRGAFVGHQSIVNCIDKEVFEEFLEECIKCPTSIKDKACTIHIDYRFLTPPDVHNTFHSEINSVHAIAHNQKLQELILHPVISSFLNIKWNKINFIAYFNLLVYFIFMLFMGIFIITFFHDSVFVKYDFGNNTTAAEGPNLKAINNTSPAGTDTDPVLVLGDKFDIGDYDDLSDNPSTAKPEVRTLTMNATEGKFEKHVPAVKPNLFALLFGFSSDESSQHSRKRRSVNKTQVTTKSEWNIRYQKRFEEYSIQYRICLLWVILITVYEIVQCAKSYKTYFFKLSNWLDICMIVLFTFVLLRSFDFEADDLKKVRALTILVMAAQSIQIIAKISVLSMSLHMAIFKRVCATFLKTIALYLIWILAFAMSFYTLNDQSYKSDGKNMNNTIVEGVNKNSNSTGRVGEVKRQSFQNPFISVITTVRMMLSDFENAEIDIEDTFEGIIFLVFVVLITVVLFNLLNALAISDTNEIMKDAELVDTKKRISILNSYEKLFVFLALTFSNVFPEMTSILIKPNRGNFVTIEENSTKSFESETQITIPCRENSCCSTSLQEYLNMLAAKKNRRNLKLNSKIIKQIVNFVKQRQHMKKQLYLRPSS